MRKLNHWIDEMAWWLDEHNHTLLGRRYSRIICNWNERRIQRLSPR